MIAVVVSAYNRCTYCIVSHGHALRVALGNCSAAEVLADYIATNWRHAGLDERRSAICAYAEKLTATPHLVTEEDLEELERVGLTKHEVWDVIEIAAMYNFTNRMALATGQQPNEEYHYHDRGPAQHVRMTQWTTRRSSSTSMQLVEEEKQLRDGHHRLTSDDRQRLQHLEEELDQAWDLLRQRRAREETGEDPDTRAGTFGQRGRGLPAVAR